MTTFIGTGKFKNKDGSWHAIVTDGDYFDAEVVTIQQYHAARYKPPFDDLPVSKWIPPKHREDDQESEL